MSTLARVPSPLPGRLEGKLSRARWAPMALAMAALLLLYAAWQLSGLSFGDRALVGGVFF